MELVLFDGFNGLIQGAFYALMALGLSLIISLNSVINFAHGGFMVIGAYLAFTLAPYIGFWGGLVFAPAVAGPAAFEIGAGALAAMTWVSGTSGTNQSATGLSDHAVGVALYGRAAGRIRLSPGWSLRLDVIGGSTAPRRPVIAIGGVPEETVTTWGVGFVAATAGVEWGF